MFVGWLRCNGGEESAHRRDTDGDSDRDQERPRAIWVMPTGCMNLDIRLGAGGPVSLIARIPQQHRRNQCPRRHLRRSKVCLSRLSTGWRGQEEA